MKSLNTQKTVGAIVLVSGFAIMLYPFFTTPVYGTPEYPKERTNGIKMIIGGSTLALIGGIVFKYKKNK